MCFFIIYQSENMEFTKENIKLICADNMKIMAQYISFNLNK